MPLPPLNIVRVEGCAIAANSTVTLLACVIVNSHSLDVHPLAEPVPDSEASLAPRLGVALTLTLVPYGCGVVHAPNVVL